MPYMFFIFFVAAGGGPSVADTTADPIMGDVALFTSLDLFD